jgi:hypothetical protein
MMKAVLFALWLVSIVPVALIAQTKIAQAVRVANGSIHIDGMLDDQVWGHSSAGWQPHDHGRRFDLYAEELRFQCPVISQQRRAAVGVQAGEHSLPSMAAESPHHGTVA